MWLGGLYASLLPDHAKLSGADYIHQGLFAQAEDVVPDYSLVPDWKGSIIFASRGCKNRCPYCIVPTLEGKISYEKRSIKKYVHPEHTKIIFFDNNILAMKYWRDIFKELVDLNLEVDFNQGLDAHLLTDEAAEYISMMNIPLLRLAYDRPEQKKDVIKAINALSKRRVPRRRTLVYTLYNFNESPNDFLNRIITIHELGAVCYPMRFQPINTLKKDAYISPKWTKEQLNKVVAARRIIGYGGTFPPYEGLINKFKEAKNFNEAFKLNPKEG